MALVGGIEKISVAGRWRIDLVGVVDDAFSNDRNSHPLVVRITKRGWQCLGGRDARERFTQAFLASNRLLTSRKLKQIDLRITFLRSHARDGFGRLHADLRALSTSGLVVGIENDLLDDVLGVAAET